MFLIDQPFVSDFVIATIKNNHYPIVATAAAQELIKDDTLNWVSESAAIKLLKSAPLMRLYSNSENALAWIEQHLGNSKLAQQIKILKDKFAFRALIQQLFPTFYYKKVALAEIQNLSPADLTFPLVIKPSVGFFSIGVHIVNDEKEWLNAQAALQPAHLQSIFPENVLNTNHFIIEEFIEGEEYAIDYYHNERGEVVILNILHHLFSSGTDTSDRVYSTSKAIIEEHQAEIGQLLEQIGRQLELRNFPAHAEVRIDATGRIVPIEINPLRSGGFCTTGDLLGLTLGFNSFQCFFENGKPDWNSIFKGKEQQKFSIIILNNNSGLEPVTIASFNYVTLAEDFENAVVVRKLDIQQYPVFGFVFTETSPKNEAELKRILTSNLKKYITTRV